MNDPQFTPADEPTGNLDPVSRKVMFDACHNEGRTIVMVTHDVDSHDATAKLVLSINGKSYLGKIEHQPEGEHAHNDGHKH